MTEFLASSSLPPLASLVSPRLIGIIFLQVKSRMMGDSLYKSTLDCFVKTLKNDVCSTCYAFHFYGFFFEIKDSNLDEQDNYRKLALPETPFLPNTWGFAECIPSGTRQRRSLLWFWHMAKNYFVVCFFFTDSKTIFCRVFFWPTAKPYFAECCRKNTR